VHAIPIPFRVPHIIETLPTTATTVQTAVHSTQATINDTVAIFGVGISQGKLIAFSMAVALVWMVAFRLGTRHKRYVPSNPPRLPEGFSHVEA
jgi:hypothetical protein